MAPPSRPSHPGEPHQSTASPTAPASMPEAHKPPRNAAGRHAAPHSMPRVHHSLAAQSRWASYTCEFLVMRVLRQQHAAIREELRRLLQLTQAALQHIDAPRSDLQAISERVRALAGELTDDIAAEEPVFTNMLELELAYVGHHPGSTHPHPAGESLDRIAEQHGHYAALLRQLRSDAIRLTTTRAATAAERRLSDHLLQLDRLLLDHFHLEDDVLLPRIARMEAELFA